MNDQIRNGDQDELAELNCEFAEIFSDEGDIRQHALVGVHQRLQARSSLGIMVGLLSTGFETISVLLNDDQPRADREHRGQ